MTRIEKEIIAAALSEYAVKHQKAADRAASKKLYDIESKEHYRANEAMAILSYWVEVIDAPSGSLKI